jgi:cytochrome c oxidase subunit 3
MYLFIASEIMLFGSFFTAYFFVRIVNGVPWPTPPYHLPVFVAGINTLILMTSSATMHWATVSIKRGNVWGMRAGLLLTFLRGFSFLISQLYESASTCRTAPSPRSSSASRACTAATCSSGSRSWPS